VSDDVNAARTAVLEFALAPLRGEPNPPVEEYASRLVDRLIEAVRADSAPVAPAEEEH
jgi:hypothetical protein